MARGLTSILPVDPADPPNEMLAVIDINPIIDAALGYQFQQARARRTRKPVIHTSASVASPGEMSIQIAPIPPGAGLEMRERDDINQSLQMFANLGTGFYGPPEEGVGVPIKVFTSVGDLELAATKLQNPLDHPDRERRGWGWSQDDAVTFLKDFVIPYVRKTGGTIFKKGEVPVIDRHLFGGEDGRVLGVADLAYRRSGQEGIPVVLTRDKGMMEEANDPVYAASNPYRVVSPTYFNNQERDFTAAAKKLTASRPALKQVMPTATSPAIVPGAPPRPGMSLGGTNPARPTPALMARRLNRGSQ